MADEIDIAVDVPVVNETEDNLSTTMTAINKLLQATKRDRTGESNAGFPYFDPDHSRVDVNKWCSDIDIRAERDNMQSFDIIPRVRAALMGRAKEWYEKYGYQYYSWSELRASLIHCFSSGADIVGQLRTVVNIESNEFNTYTDFVMEKTSQINRLPFEIPEEKIVKIVVGCIADVSLRNSLTFNMPTSVQILIDNLSTIREKPYKKIDQTHRFANNEYPIPPYAEHYRKRNDMKNYPSKRPRLSEDKRCFGCGKVGHIHATCPENLFKNKQTPLILDKQKEANRKTNECTFCKKRRT